MDKLEIGNDLIPTYPVRLGELALITVGAITIVGAGFAGLGLRMLGHAFDSDRVEAIAKTIVDYQIPGGSQGVFGVNIGGAKLAQVHSIASPPTISLVVSKALVARETEDTASNPIPSDDSEQQFIVTTSRIEPKQFCGKSIPVTVEVGEQTFTSLATRHPAIRYTVSTIEADVERTVILIANGDQRQQQIESVFKSLRCR